MASPLIQFRLKDNARQVLEGLAFPGESLNLTAQRLLMEALDRSTAVDEKGQRLLSVDQVVDKSVDAEESLIERLTPAIAQQVRAEIEARLSDLVNHLIETNLPAAVEVVLGKVSPESSGHEVAALQAELKSLERERDDLDKEAQLWVERQGNSQALAERLQSELEETHQQIADRQQEIADLKAELEQVRVQQTTQPQARNLPEAATLLNQFKGKYPQSKVTLKDVEGILELLNTD